MYTDHTTTTIIMAHDQVHKITYLLNFYDIANECKNNVHYICCFSIHLYIVIYIKPVDKSKIQEYNEDKLVTEQL